MSIEYDGESDSESYTSLEVFMRRVLKVGIPDSDDKFIQEFDHARGQTRKDIYHAVFRVDSDAESEEDEPQPKIIQRSTKARNSNCFYYDSEDNETLKMRCLLQKSTRKIRIRLIM